MNWDVMPRSGMVSKFSAKQTPVAVPAAAAFAVASETSLPVGAALATAPSTPLLPILPLPQTRDFTPPDELLPAPLSPLARLLNFLHHYSLAVFALLFLAVGAAGITVGASYWSAHIISQAKPVAAIAAKVPTISGLNLTVPAKDLQAKLQTITSQPATLTVGTQTIPVGSDTIRTWLQTSSNADKSEYYIRIKAGTIAASLNQLANQFVKAPVNQVTINEAGTDRMVVAGRTGTALSDSGSLKTQADQLAKTVMDSKGLQFNTPLQTVAFQAVTPAAFDKVLDVNVSTKQMYAYQGGQLVNTFAVSAGAPETPTNIGEFKIYAKYAVQDMRGFNPDGSKYFQPHVPWVNYFSGGDAVHGNYWRPASVFGSVNTSHGCVSVPVDEGAWIYNWAPIGTTVITHV
jgi:lipoprotein-anchoring transpeptidase ErfK/SrfK